MEKPMTMKSEIDAARARHDRRVAELNHPRWRNELRGLTRGSARVMEMEIAAIKKRAANDNEKRLARCAGTVTDENPLTGKER
jgi:hypothetical protein